jgi:histidinol-phosphate aminotransferase
MDSSVSLARPAIARISGYVPGEQPQEAGWTKLNTNENPYPPSPRVREAMLAAADRLAVYPDPLGTRFRKVAADVLGVDPDWILPGNGSDEVLTILMRTFVDPAESIAYPYPSYILYETLAEIQGTGFTRLQLQADWSWEMQAQAPIRSAAKLVIVPNPNSPSGNMWDDATLFDLAPPRGLLVIDEAYRDFADEPRSMDIFASDIGNRLILTRTLSKSYSLAGLRFGFAVAHPDLITEMRKVKDSYNCDALSLAAAEAALRDQEWMRENVRKVRATRARLDTALRQLGFDTVPSQANFLWATHPTGKHGTIYESLKSRKVLVRWMKFPGAHGSTIERPFDGLRITVGTDEQVDRFLAMLSEVLPTIQ